MAYLQDIAQQRRVQPQDDLISVLVQAHDEGDALTDGELNAHLVTLLTGGYDTTSAGLGNAVFTLLCRPASWAALGHTSVTAEQASEELLRFESPFQYAVRRASQDLELGGQHIQAGELVWLWIGSANRDPMAFARPNELDLTRAGNSHMAHLAFGMGIHYCLGAPLVRLEMQLALSSLRQRYPKLQLIDRELRWRSGSVVRSLETLPLRLT